MCCMVRRDTRSASKHRNKLLRTAGSPTSEEGPSHKTSHFRSSNTLLLLVACFSSIAPVSSARTDCEHRENVFAKSGNLMWVQWKSLSFELHGFQDIRHGSEARALMLEG